MRQINRIVIHCSATKSTQTFTAEQVKQSHLQRGFKTWGYHFYIRTSGTVNEMRPLSELGAHAKGFNANSIGICYEGGLDPSGKAVDTRTDVQKSSMHKLVKDLVSRFAIKNIDGHRDLSPDLNGNGIIEPNEWIKMCPCFDVHKEFNCYL